MVAIPIDYIKKDLFDIDITSKIDFGKMLKDYIKMVDEIDSYHEANATDEETKHIRQVVDKVRMIEALVEEVVK